MNNLEKRIKAVEDRNKRVESDKAWEKSWTRRLTIASSTYLVAMLYLIIINNEEPFLNALVPAGGYLLSTLVLKNMRKMWQKEKM